MRLRNIAILIFLSTALSNCINAQEWRIKSYNLGYRIFELTPVGNNPITITPLLKDPAAYKTFLNTITTNSVYGNPEILHLHTLYLNAEFQKDSSLFRFWKKYTLQAGLILTTRINQNAGAIGDEGYVFSPDTAIYRNMYSLTKNQQFFGVNVGLNRRFKISEKLKIITGLHVQGSFAIVHNYQQRWDSSTYSPAVGWDIRTTHLPNLKGKNFFQWQILVPLGLEYELIKEKFLIRFELDAGIVGSHYTPKDFAAKEAHGIGLWLIYIPQRNRLIKSN
jgi:hypothetical protein